MRLGVVSCRVGPLICGDIALCCCRFVGVSSVVLLSLRRHVVVDVVLSWLLCCHLLLFGVVMLWCWVCCSVVLSLFCLVVLSL